MLSSIAEVGTKEPLTCIKKSEESYIILDGFKRLRCLYKLKIELVPIVIIGSDERDSIVKIIHLSNNKTLQTLEQSRFIDELHRNFGLTIRSIADRLDVSPAWVGVRLGLLDEMSETVKNNIFSGRFPMRSYIYSIKKLTRVNKVDKSMIDRFVSLVSGKNFSTRDIDTLAYDYFSGGPKIQKQIEHENISWILKALKDKTASLSQDSELNPKERRVINDMELLQKYILKVIKHCSDPVSENEPFIKNVALLIDGNTRITVRKLFDNGRAKKEITRIVGIDIKTVRSILKSENDSPEKKRSDKITVSEERLKILYSSCNGYVHRIHEMLSEDYKIELGYSTLTRMLRDLGISKNETIRSIHFQDVPGEEMQHDTSSYTIEIGGVKTRVICSSRYSDCRFFSWKRCPSL